MVDIENISNKSLRPLEILNKTNEIIDALNDNLNMNYVAENPVLTSVNGKCIWTVTHNLGTENINYDIYEGSDAVTAGVSIVSENVITVTFNSNSNIPANTFQIVIIANGSNSSSGGGSGNSLLLSTSSDNDGTLIMNSTTLDTELNSTSINGVQNKVIYNALQNIGNQNAGYTAASPALTQSDGILTWVVNHNLNTENIIVSLYNSNGIEIVKKVDITSANSITLTFNSNTDASAEDYRVVVIASKAVMLDNQLSATSINPVQNKIIYEALDNKADIALSNISATGIETIFLNAFKTTASEEITFTGTSTSGNFTDVLWTATRNGFINLVLTGDVEDFIQFYGYKDGNYNKLVSPRVRVPVVASEALLYYPCVKGVTYRATYTSTMTITEKKVYYWDK